MLLLRLLDGKHTFALFYSQIEGITAYRAALLPSDQKGFTGEIAILTHSRQDLSPLSIDLFVLM